MYRRQSHEWKKILEDGRTQLYRAVFHAKEWQLLTTIRARRREDTDWETIDEVPIELWQELRDILFKKYQRKRCPWKFVENLDRILEDA